jgi:hypothetical protein
MAAKKSTKKTTTKKSPSKTKGKKGGSTMMVGAAGAVAGAALGAAAAMALANERNRQKLGKAVDGVSAYAADALEAADDTAYDMHHKATEKLHKTTKPAKKSSSTTKN